MEEIGRTPEENETKIRLLLNLMAEWTNDGIQTLHGTLKINFGVKEDSNKLASLKKAVRILDGVNKAEELLPGFIAAIDRLAADSELLLKMGHESQAVVHEKFMPDMTLSAFRTWTEG
ncbi:MAG: hypothetical protein K5787_20995 [Lentisphaeria bacterium]|nr:hypothetical protein [Victivallales bacterium]MCR4576242.1 hypothetical protein [Lentisphaeria bacterium]